MVSHFKTHHKNSEVFVSRISERMVDEIKNNKRSFVKCTKQWSHSQPDAALHTKCIFCEEDKSFPVHYWTDHIRSHTGEYGNYCSVCNQRCSFNNHCGITTIKKDDFDLRKNHMYAYRCIECNFVQTHYKNIEKHLKDQHQLITVDKKHYGKFILLPAYNLIKVQKSDNPRGEPRQGIKSYSQSSD